MKNVVPVFSFNDISADDWYSTHVLTLNHYGILNGYPDGSFKPNQPITRSELAAMVSKFDHLAETNENPYSDIVPNNWAYSYILSATKKGWLQGSGGLFRPDDLLTRAEFVTVANRVMIRHIRLEDIPAGLHVFDDFRSSHWSYSAFTEAIYTHDFVRKADGIFEEWTQITGDGLAPGVK